MTQTNSSTVPTINLAAPEGGGSRRAARLLEELASLLQRAHTPEEFHAEFLKHVLAALKGVAGGVWLRAAHGGFTLQYQVNLAEIGLDRIPNARACHAELLRTAAEQDRAV